MPELVVSTLGSLISGLINRGSYCDTIQCSSESYRRSRTGIIRNRDLETMVLLRSPSEFHYRMRDKLGDMAMYSRRELLGGVVAASVTVTAGCLGFGSDREVRSEFVYSAEIIPMEMISTATFYLPVPVHDGVVAIDGRFDDTAFEPDGWSLEIVETDRDPMLEVTTDEIRPRNQAYDMGIDWTVDNEIDTRAALSNEATLQPKDDIEQVECAFPHPDRMADQLRCYTYVGSFYGVYEPTGVDVAIGTRLHGDNSWYNGGWTGNNFSETLTGLVDGTGWATGTASFREGFGNY